MNVASAMQAIRKPPKQRTEVDVDVLMPLCSGLAFFKQLPQRVVRHLVKKVRLVEVSPQKIICEQGTQGETLHVILSGSCAVFQCNDDELRRLRLSHKPSRRMSDGDWTPIYDSNQSWIRQSQMTRTQMLSGNGNGNTNANENTDEKIWHTTNDKKTDNSDSNNKNNDSEDSDDEIYNMDHDLLYPSANTTPEWYVSKIEN